MPITVPHEFVAVSMAQGYAMITGEPQVVMVHVIVGTGNASAAVMNASRLNVPMIFSAGRTPLTEEGMTRQPEQFHSLGAGVFRSGQLAARVHAVGLRAAQRRSSGNRRRSSAGNGARQSARSGLFNSAARSAGAKDGFGHDSSVSQKPSGSIAAERRKRIKRTAEVLRGAINPLIITGRLGSDPTAVSAMVSFAEALVGAGGDAGEPVRELPQHP